MHHRWGMRLDTWNYRFVAVYFVTITTHARVPWFGTVTDGKVRLSRFGEITHEEWVRSATLRADVELDLVVVMPDHIHGLVILCPADQTDLPSGSGRFESRSLGALVGGFKAASSH